MNSICFKDLVLGSKMLVPIILLAVTAFAQNEVYPDTSRLIFEGPEALTKASNNGLFGYSIAYQPHHNKKEKSLIITAPTANPVGAIFRCDFNTTECTQINIDLTNPSEEMASHLWLGAKVQARSSLLVTCSPRSLHKYNDLLGTFADCYHFNSSTENIKQTDRLPPLSPITNHADILKHYNTKDTVRWGDESYKRLYKMGFSKHPFPIQYQMNSFGWSIAVANDDIFLIGGPAMLIGRVIVYRNGIKSDPSLISIDNDELGKTNGRVEYNFGYSVTSGKFFMNKTTYVVSSTYGEIGKGKVLFFDTNLKYIKATIVDDNIGSMFGASLCPATLSDGGSFLLVGAPTWTSPLDPSDSTPQEQVGAVHLYVADKVNKDTVSWKRHRTMSEFKQNSYFGSEIVNLGDLNGDGKDEIAVAAPYEDGGRGAVYIYSGSELLKNAKEQEIVPHIKKIVGTALGDNVGLGIAALKDYDENGCNELAIGVPGGKKVMLYRCMASVTIKLGVLNYRDVLENLKAIEEINDENTYVELKPCLYVNYDEKPQNIKTEIIVKAEMSDNVKAEGNKTFIARLIERKHQYCESIKLFLYQNGDYDKPIEFNLTASILDTPKTFDPESVVLSERSADKFWINFNVSGSRLSHEFDTTLRQNYLIGSTKLEQIRIRVKNSGRHARSWCVRAHIEGVKILNVTAECDVQGYGEVVCTSIPLSRDGLLSTIFLDTETLTSASEDVTILIRLYKICNEATSIIEGDDTTISLTTDDSVTVTGTSTPQLNVTKDDLKIGEQTVKHYYEIKNSGVTLWKGVKYDIALPPQVNAEINSTGVCVVTAGTAKCTLDDLPRNSSEVIVVTMTVIPGAFASNFPHSSISTHLSLEFGKLTTGTRVETKIKILKSPVPLWIIIVATFIGLLIVVLIAFILRECGYLKRKNKENLENLKEKIKRQSQIRMSAQVRDSIMINEPNHGDKETLMKHSESEDDAHHDINTKCQGRNNSMD